MATSLVRGDSSRSNSSSRNSPLSEIGAHLRTAPLRSRWKCHGTMLEWCSMTDSTISSPSPMPARKESATRLMAAVAFLVKMISSTLPALRKRRVSSRASSKCCVAVFDR
jgi:hypothetical protein